ncbi:MAG TPA: molybdopterin-dependent oxidoreductase [Caulobacteraceae bacterium]|nr:molybdopterin-dependent oxidoreductase [Caulobacteraceae bacterium]
MKSRLAVSRRGLIAGASAGLGGLVLAGCDRLSRAPSYRDLLNSAEGLTYRSQRLLEAAQPLAREFPASAISRIFKLNGSIQPGGAAYHALLADNFASYRLAVGGLVARPLSLSLDQLKALAARTQITRHDCVEGWSAIGQWSGARLGPLLLAAGLRPSARYIVFHCADDLGGPGSPYYESIDLVDAFHPQTILAYALNGQPLPVGHGAPIRLRVERQLGYKQAKFVMGIEAVDRLDGIQGGKGGFWEDRGYEWYAGI